MKAAKVMDVDITGIAYEIFGNRELFNKYTYRQEYPLSAHYDTETIYLRMFKGFSEKTNFADDRHMIMDNITEFEDLPELRLFPLIGDLIDHIDDKLDFRMHGWVTIVKLKGGKDVTCHTDDGKYCNHFDRFHIPIIANDSHLDVDFELFQVKPGEVWAFDNQLPHGAHNLHKNDRIHIIFDAI